MEVVFIVVHTATTTPGSSFCFFIWRIWLFAFFMHLFCICYCANCNNKEARFQSSDYCRCRWGNRRWNIPCALEKFLKLTLRSQRYMPALSLFLLFFKAKTLRNQLDYSKVSTQLYECLYSESARSVRYELLMLFHNVTQISVLLWTALLLQVS